MSTPAAVTPSFASYAVAVSTTVTTPSPIFAADPTALSSPTSISKVKTPSKPKFPPILPCRPVRPFCPPDKADPLSQLPAFLEDLRFKVHVNSNKYFKVKHIEIVKTFMSEKKATPEIIFKSRNYEITFLEFCEESDKPLYLRIYEHLPI